ncbi:hypothetical protein BT96DRAFT_1044546 [Gymnopus androsaceus JB14]|uniref:Uncharacterized protein n=1 Tax=Gymnopus androsaceus JB14 TaxID=1447944 RepID=A0A6A4HBA8_9AGAR|nr:hypothetical protein BT96DRAFT_1044546 [Gymnopus androsaceus JB14]
MPGMYCEFQCIQDVSRYFSRRHSTALYVYCALAESLTNPDGHSDMSFYIDGTLQGSFMKVPSANQTAYRYNVPNGHVNGVKSLVLFDQIVYTETTLASSSASPASTTNNTSYGSNKKSLESILVPALAVPIIVLLAALGMWLFLQRRKRLLRQRELLRISSYSAMGESRTSEMNSLMGMRSSQSFDAFRAPGATLFRPSSRKNGRHSNFGSTPSNLEAAAAGSLPNEGPPAYDPQANPSASPKSNGRSAKLSRLAQDLNYLYKCKDARISNFHLFYPNSCATLSAAPA